MGKIVHIATLLFSETHQAFFALLFSSLISQNKMADTFITLHVFMESTGQYEVIRINPLDTVMSLKAECRERFGTKLVTKTVIDTLQVADTLKRAKVIGDVLKDGQVVYVRDKLAK